MTYEPKTISDQIECLARLTGAPDSFVDQVKCLFSNKGIDLDDNASPYLDALEDAFRREESIRCSSFRARENIAKLQHNFQKVGKAYVKQISQLKKIQSSLQEQSRRLRRASGRVRSNKTHVTIKGDHRTYVTRPERDDLPMVPGPKEVQ